MPAIHCWRAKGVPILARTASLIAHLLEEQQRPIGFVLSHTAAQRHRLRRPDAARLRPQVRAHENRRTAGIRVVEQGTFITGPCAGMMLADLGADVIKIEEPRRRSLPRLPGRAVFAALPGLQPQQAQRGAAT